MMEASVARQERLQMAIERSLPNFKKVGKKNLTPAMVRTRIATLRELWSLYREADLNIAETTSREQKETLDYFVSNRFAATEDVYESTLDYMVDFLEQLQPSACESPADKEPVSHPGTSSAHATQLPPIRVPPFSGNFEEWEGFRDRFDALIIRNPSITDFARMHYLVSSLSGRAHECIASLPVTADSFTIAWNALKDRFEDKKRLISIHLSTLLNLPALHRESATELQQLRDRTNFAIASLENLERTAANLWEDMLVLLVSQRFDPSTKKAWNIKISDDKTPPSFQLLQQFVDSRVRALEGVDPRYPPNSSTKPAKPNCARVHTATASPHFIAKCPLCQGRHYLSSCSQFLSKTPKQRTDIVRKFSRCINCLSLTHSASACPSKHSCRVCQRRHHSLLHDDSTSPVTPSASSPPQEAIRARDQSVEELRSHSVITKCEIHKPVLLATAWVRVSSEKDRSLIVRALLDPGSEVSFITESVAQAIRAKRTRVAATITAVGGVRTATVRNATYVRVSSRSSPSSSVPMTAMILSSLSTYAPRGIIDSKSLDHLSDLPWADPDPTSADPILLIIGADVYHDVILDGLRQGSRGQPTAQNTIFGWVISGPVQSKFAQTNNIAALHCCQADPLGEELRRFWEIEELPRQAPHLSVSEQLCENHFLSNTTRTRDGQYIVRLPFKTEPPLDIGASRPTAEKLLNSLRRRLHSRPALAKEYEEFLREYKALGHMRCAFRSSKPPSQCVYIPHHPVLRHASSTTRLRVVFNASHVTANGTSLNDHLLPGPKLQTDLSAIILRWRQFRYVYVADIAKMYRQILIDPRDRDYQRILWNEPHSSALTEYQLLTVTYGMNCAPYLALRVLKRLCDDEGLNYPLAVSVLRNNLYVDDVLFGHDDPSSLSRVRHQLIQLLRRGHFTLRKWASNSTALLSDIDPKDHGLACPKDLSRDDNVKVLGVEWSPSLDAFQFNVNPADGPLKTKRSVLSTIAKLYDPLGWVTPAIVTVKIFLQELWRNRVTWDEPLSGSLLIKWNDIYSRLLNLKGLSINRWTGCRDSGTIIELHGFADASTAAYSAVTYLKLTDSLGNVTVSLLSGKSKVAPLTPLTIPRLELCAAVLLSRLISFVRANLNLPNARCVCWTDSSVVLNWIQQHPSRWKTFVANRVATIQGCVPNAEWRHISTSENPADCASRGLYGDELRDHELWWEGPSWLKTPDSEWPVTSISAAPSAMLEERCTVAHSSLEVNAWSLESRYSSWPKLLRVTAYIMRFVHSCKARVRSEKVSPNSALSLSAAECSAAKLFWIKRLQFALFPLEIHALRKEKPLPPRSSILSLCPFLDKDGVLRVGGRLRHSNIPFRVKHPVLLASHPLVRLIVQQAHQQALHAGLQLTLNILRSTYWILRARSLVRNIIHSCIVCVRERASPINQLMGDLPSPRVTQPAKCFAHCGLDYAGPVKVRASSGRGIKSQKAYISLFVCLSTKAIHLELVGDYSSPAFVNAFTRFCSRRGIPEAVYSDNGSTFVGANRELTTAYRNALRDPKFQNKVACDGVSWHFIPPTAPHFGGLWEAGVRSVKHHLRRVLSDRALTYEEFYTLLCTIEACLNSRPIAPLSDAFDDREPLTPGHFLIGSALTVPPEPSILNLSENRLSRWQLVRQMTERFWKIWRSDYLNTLQQRNKWRRIQPPVKVGQLVLVRNSALPPCKWELARVIQLHPGPDGLTRVVTIKTATSELKRPIVQLCPLPVESANPPN